MGIHFGKQESAELRTAREFIHDNPELVQEMERIGKETPRKVSAKETSREAGSAWSRFIDEYAKINPAVAEMKSKIKTMGQAELHRLVYSPENNK